MYLGNLSCIYLFVNLLLWNNSRSINYIHRLSRDYRCIGSCKIQHMGFVNSSPNFPPCCHLIWLWYNSKTRTIVLTRLQILLSFHQFLHVLVYVCSSVQFDSIINFCHHHHNQHTELFHHFRELSYATLLQLNLLSLPTIFLSSDNH